MSQPALQKEQPRRDSHECLSSVYNIRLCRPHAPSRFSSLLHSFEIWPHYHLVLQDLPRGPRNLSSDLSRESVPGCFFPFSRGRWVWKDDEKFGRGIWSISPAKCSPSLMNAVTDAIGVANDGLTAPRTVQNAPDARQPGLNVFMKRPGRSRSMKRE